MDKFVLVAGFLVILGFLLGNSGPRVGDATSGLGQDMNERIVYVRQGHNLLASIQDGELVHHHANQLGSVVARTTSDDVEKIDYTPYGKSDEPNSRYTGKPLTATNAVNLGAREYDSELRRFHIPDPIINDIVSPYAYASNNPYLFTDPDGEEVQLVFRWADKIPLIMHSYLIVYPEPPSKFSEPYNKPFTLGGVVDREGGEFTIHFGVNRPQDVEPGTFMFFDKVRSLYAIPAPEGMTDAEFVQKLVDVASEMNSQDEKIKYHELAFLRDCKNEANCNTILTALLKKAGVSPEAIKEIDVPVGALGFGNSGNLVEDEQEDETMSVAEADASNVDTGALADEEPKKMR